MLHQMARVPRPDHSGKHLEALRGRPPCYLAAPFFMSIALKPPLIFREPVLPETFFDFLLSSFTFIA